ncbi:putative inosine-uridine preferring nucleoside hydrolase-like [Scophthalmus maximus]|uniref:Putative inosine-uridine preferring nucleoside hydrolase-like n=1 Tax=Scophthalmus maximus TaxID=52904 RepID=A0A2U9BA85_SCOMX|nr:putative inosine-uridine preferring nucleoside hydrolase-like [Scophthalmus maximus]
MCNKWCYKTTEENWVDDAQAIMLAPAAPDVEILAITCCHGNTPLENVVKNTLRVLRVCNRLDFLTPCMALYEACPITSYTDPGILRLLAGIASGSARSRRSRPAAAAEEVTLMATAPLTNLAVAVQLEPSFPEKLKALYITGGNCDSRGNTTVCGEFNFVANPEAAHTVLDRYTCPTYIATWEFSCRSSLPWSFCDQWLAQDTVKAAFMKKILSLSMTVTVTSQQCAATVLKQAKGMPFKAKSADFQKETTEGKGFNSCDIYAMVAAINDTVITESEEVAVTVELEGKFTRGMMVLDYMELLKKKHKAFVMKTVEFEKLKKKCSWIYSSRTIL